MGPLAGLKVIEMKGIGPVPYAGMLLADLGAEVVVVERSSNPAEVALPSARDLHSRGKQSIAIDLKQPRGVELLLRLVADAQVLIEGYRPGVAERLGFGPEDCFAVNPKLVFGRLTGWGQSGPLANAAGHDINYIGLAGALAAIGERDKPVPPLNLVGDFAGGSLFLIVGVLAALLEAERSGQGQVVDAAITDGTAHLMSMFCGLHDLGRWSGKRAANLLDGGAGHYNVYETADGKWISIAPLERRFRQTFAELTGLDAAFVDDADDPAAWSAQKKELSELFKSRTQDEWCTLLEGTDACFAPVLDYRDAFVHPHHRARSTFLDLDGVVQPAPAPRFGRSKTATPHAPPAEGANTVTVLQDWGVAQDDIAALQRAGVLT